MNAIFKFFYKWFNAFWENAFLKWTLFAIFLVKLPFIFHGYWSADVFAPYMTDETVTIAPLQHYLFNHGKTIADMVAFDISYPPLFEYGLAFYFKIVFEVLSFFEVSLTREFLYYEFLYYNTRIFVLICMVIGSYYYVKAFDGIFRSRFFQLILLILLNFQVLFFLQGQYVKHDGLVWGLGAISIYFGRIFYEEKSLKSYYYFFISSLLPVLFMVYGFIYFLFFIAISFWAMKRVLIPKYVPIILFTVATPALWLLANYHVSHLELAARIFSRYVPLTDFLNLSSLETASTWATDENLWLKGAGTEPPVIFYQQYLDSLVLPVLLIIPAIGYFFYKGNIFYKIYIATHVIFFIVLVLADYRTDRLLMPIISFVYVAVLFFFNGFKDFRNLRLAKVGTYFLIFSYTVLVGQKTFAYASSLMSRDSRQSLLFHINESLPENSRIGFIHFSICAPSTFLTYPMTLPDAKKFDLSTFYLESSDPKKLKELQAFQGYFAMCLTDFEVLKKFKTFPRYSQSFQALSELLDRSKLVKEFDELGFMSDKFGPRDMVPNYIYILRSAPLALFKTNDG